MASLLPRGNTVRYQRYVTTRPPGTWLLSGDGRQGLFCVWKQLAVSVGSASHAHPHLQERRRPNGNYRLACQRLRSCFCWLSPRPSPCHVWLSLTRGRSAAAGDEVSPPSPPYVEHQCQRALVSGGAGESLSSVPTGLRPAAEN